MSSANLLAGHAGGGQARTYAVSLAFSVDTQDGRREQIRELRARWEAAFVGPDPVGHADLERGIRIEPEQTDGFNLRLQIGRQPVDDERQHIRAERIPNE